MSSRWSIGICIVCLALLGHGLTRLFQLRFARGDIYPPYSSLRTDPLGGRVLYEALPGAGVSTRRNFRDLKRVTLANATFYVPGVNWSWAEQEAGDDWERVLQAVNAGARLVVTVAPEARPFGGQSERQRSFGRSGDDAENQPAGHEIAGGPKLRDLLGLEVKWMEPLEAKDTRQASRAASFLTTNLPAGISWQSAVGFDLQDDAWRPVYQVGEIPAVAERNWGAGSIVVLGNAFLLSNEAMANARQAGLLQWIQGPFAEGVFDESQLGVRENAGVATLARRYGLRDAALALAIVAVLFLWRNGTSLVPRTETPGAGAMAGNELTGRASAAGLVNLLRRTIDSRTLFSTCAGEFRRSMAWRRLTPGDRDEFERVAQTPEQSNPLAAMRAAHALLAHKQRSFHKKS